MWNRYDMYEEDMYAENGFLSVRDSVEGTVIGECRKGLFIELDNGEYAFSYFGKLFPGTRVMCTVMRKARENLHTRVSIDTVYSAAPEAA